VATGNPSVPISLTPIGPPSAPFGVSAKAGNERARVSWNAPASNGGSPITSFHVIPYIGSTPQNPVTVSPSTTSKRITGLKNGTTYTFVVTATNKVGTSRSEASPPVTPATVPGAAALKGTAGRHSATLTWTPPTATGGDPIRGYEVYIGTSRTTISSTPVNKSLIRKNARSYKVTGLKNGTTYYFILKAVNRVGLGARSNVVKLKPRP
jgi:predicted phage tail protein